MGEGRYDGRDVGNGEGGGVGSMLGDAVGERVGVVVYPGVGARLALVTTIFPLHTPSPWQPSWREYVWHPSSVAKNEN